MTPRVTDTCRGCGQGISIDLAMLTLDLIGFELRYHCPACGALRSRVIPEHAVETLVFAGVGLTDS
jgi:hypothetical protein